MDEDALGALERLVFRHKVVTEEQARAAARLISGDPNFAFPPPAPPARAEVAANSSLNGSESL